MKKILYSAIALVIASATLTSCEDVPMPYGWPTEIGGGNNNGGTVAEPSGSGTAADPYNIASANKIAAALAQGENSAANIYIKGKVVSIKEITDASSFGNATFYLSDDGTATNQFYVYRCYGLDNKKITSTDIIKVGDEVVVCGTLTNYNGTLETVQNKAYIVSVNGTGGNGGTETPGTGGSTGEVKGTGTAADPYNVAGILSIQSSFDASKEYYVSGTISKVDKFNSNYGSINYYISEDGSANNEFYIYSGLGLDKAKFASIDDLKVGSKVTVCGKLTVYNGTYEMQYNNYIVTLDGTGGNGGTENPGTGSSAGVSIDNTANTVTLTNAAVTAGTQTVEVIVNDLGITDKAVVAGQTYTLSDGTKLTLSKGGGKNDPTFYSVSKGFRIYALNTITFESSKQIAKIVMTCDEYNGTKYVGNETATVAFSGNTAVYTNFHSSDSGGVQLRPQKIVITYAK